MEVLHQHVSPRELEERKLVPGPFDGLGSHGDKAEARGPDVGGVWRCGEAQALDPGCLQQLQQLAQQHTAQALGISSRAKGCQRQHATAMMMGCGLV